MKKRGLVLVIFAATACGESTPLRSDELPASEESTGKRDAGSRDTDNSASAKADAATATKRDAGGRPSERPSESVEESVCESFQISSGQVRPDMLIVLDRSSSMKTGLVNRWDPSVRGLTSITAALDSEIRFGLMVFPGSGGQTGGAGLRCEAGTLEIPIELHAGAAIGDKLQELQLVETTPTASTLAAAHKVLSEIQPPADLGVKGTPYVVLVTDGAPNCGDEGLGGRGGGQGAVDDSVAAIAAMAKEGIKTFVVGYDTKSDPQLNAALDTMARAGATGETEHREIEDEASLVAAFKAIANTAVSCNLQLDQAPPDPSYVLVKLGSKQLAYQDPNGWILSADKKTLTVQGTACAELSSIKVTSLSVEVKCSIVQLI